MGIALGLLAGIACAALGGEFFVRGLASLAVWWRVPPGIVGATVAAFATSAPEMSVAVNSAARRAARRSPWATSWAATWSISGSSWGSR